MGWTENYALRRRSAGRRNRSIRANEPHAGMARSSAVRAEQFFALASGEPANRPRRVQERERGYRICRRIRRLAARLAGSGRRDCISVLIMERRDSTIGFLRITASQLRRLAERVPEIADELRSLAQQLDDEADDLAPDLS